MPKTKTKPTRTRKKKTATNELARELTVVKAEVAQLRDKCQRLNRTLVRLICPKEWLEEEVDDDELWANAVWVPSLKDWIAKLSK